MTKFILDSGDPNEYKEISKLASSHSSEIWGSTTNPSLIAKKLTGKKLSREEAFALQKDLVLQILQIVPGAVSAEVYAEIDTPAEEMIKQGRGIARWDARVVVKLPTTVEGFKARTALRQESILTNNTLVFSAEQIYAICLHEEIMHRNFSPRSKWPPFISPFVGRLDDQTFDGMDLVQQGMRLKHIFNTPLWMLEASVRTVEDMKRGIKLGSELITVPAKVYREWFGLPEDERTLIEPMSKEQIRNDIPEWKPPVEFLTITTIEDFYHLIESGVLNINHPLTEQGIFKFKADWDAILA